MKSCVELFIGHSLYQANVKSQSKYIAMHAGMLDLLNASDKGQYIADKTLKFHSMISSSVDNVQVDNGITTCDDKTRADSGSFFPYQPRPMRLRKNFDPT